MSSPTLAYSVGTDGKRYVTVDGGIKLPSNNTTAPSGTHDVKSVNGNKVISVAGNLHEPLDVATALNKL